MPDNKNHPDSTGSFEQRGSDLRSVLSTPQGRRCLWTMMNDFGLYATSFHADNAHITAYREGLRQAALSILRDAQEYCPALFRLMMDENVYSSKT